MKLAILADVHANAAALEAVCAAVAKERCDRVLFLGDLVGYGPDPERCVQMLRELKPIAVKGNHDHWAAESGVPKRVGDEVLKNVMWTRQQLSAGSRAFLYNLPHCAQFRGLGLVHATNAMTRSWPFVRGERRLRSNFTHQREDICFHGHTHVQLVGLEDKTSHKCWFEPLSADNLATVSRQQRGFLNPGSVGQPRDGDPRASFAICELRKRRVRFCRCEYDVEATVARMRAEGLPDNMALRLRHGR